MRRTRQRSGRQVRPVHWLGFVIVAGLFVMVLLGGDVGPAFGVTGLILVGTAVFHAVRGGSWLQVFSSWFKGSPIVIGFVIGAVFFAIGWVAPASPDDSAAGRAAEPTAVTALVGETVTPTPTPTRTSTFSPTPNPSPTISVPARVESPTPTPTVSALAHPAAAMLAELEVKGRAPKTGYDRDEFGQRWADVDRNGCDTRNDILGRDLANSTFKPGTRDCVVLTGVLSDPFTGTLIEFDRSGGASDLIHIDHVVALGDAWQKGAQQLDPDTRTAFANDPLNLLAVDGTTNLQKGDGDAATWLPPNKAFRCEYVAIQIAVKHRYALWVTQAEHDAMARILSGCPDQEAVGGGEVVATLVPGSPSAQAAVEPSKPAGLTAATPQASQAPMTEPPAALAEVPAAPAKDVYYKNCDAVRAAGAAPILRGEPGYRKALDRDGDGVGCE